MRARWPPHAATTEERAGERWQGGTRVEARWLVVIGALALLLGACGGMDAIDSEEGTVKAPATARVGKQEQRATVEQAKGAAEPDGYALCGYVEKHLGTVDCTGMDEATMIAWCTYAFGTPSSWCQVFYPSCLESVGAQASCAFAEPPIYPTRHMHCRALRYDWI